MEDGHMGDNLGLSLRIDAIETLGVYRIEPHSGWILAIVYDKIVPWVTVGDNVPLETLVNSKVNTVSCWIDTYLYANIRIHTPTPTKLTLFKVVLNNGGHEYYIPHSEILTSVQRYDIIVVGTNSTIKKRVHIKKGKEK
jgi:hypothetical protein